MDKDVLGTLAVIFRPLYYDFFNRYLVPIICSIGLTTNLVSIFVLIKTGLKEQIFKYMLVSLMMDFWFLVLHFFKFLTHCGSLCAYSSNEKSVQIFELYFQLFIGNVLITFSSLLDITVSLDRMFSFDSWYFKVFRKISFRIRCLVLIVVSILINGLIYPGTRSVQQLKLNNSESFKDLFTIKHTYTGLLKEPIVEFVVFLCSILRGSFLCFIVLVVNIIICYRLKEKAKAKNRVLPNFNTKKSSKIK